MKLNFHKTFTNWLAIITLGILPVTAQASESRPLKVVASFSILADMVQQVGGKDVEVTSLVGPNEDSHVFDPSPADAKALAQADVVVINGLGYEGWIDRLIKSSGFKGQLVVATEGVKPIELGDDGKDKHDHGKHDHGKHDHGKVDPHAWQDLGNAKIYVQNIRDGLIKASPHFADDFKLRTDAYLVEIDALNLQTRVRLAEIPAQDRRVIASHGAFAYFGRAYGVEFFSLQGWTTEREPSAAEVARLVREIKHDDIKAMFVENMSDPRLLKSVADETGVRIGGKLYSDALSARGTPGDTYLKMFAHNADLIWSVLQH